MPGILWLNSNLVSLIFKKDYEDVLSFMPTSSEMSSSERRRSSESFGSLEKRIDGFIGSQLPPMDVLEPNSRDFGAALLTHTLAYASSIQLHSPFVDRDPRSMTKSVAAAEASVGLLRRAKDADYLPPIMGVLWGNVGRVLAKEASRLRRSLRGGNREGELLRDLDKLMDVMSAFVGGSPLIREYF